MIEGLLDGMQRGGGLVVRGGRRDRQVDSAPVCRSPRWEAGLRKLFTAGAQSESRLPSAGLHQLLYPMLSHLEQLPAPQRAALEAAFGIAETAARDLFLIAMATLGLLSDAAAQVSVLLFAGGAQWFDRSTTDVLAFVARRVGADPIVLLIETGRGVESALEGGGLPDAGPLETATTIPPRRGTTWHGLRCGPGAWGTCNS